MKDFVFKIGVVNSHYFTVGTSHVKVMFIGNTQADIDKVYNAMIKECDYYQELILGDNL